MTGILTLWTLRNSNNIVQKIVILKANTCVVRINSISQGETEKQKELISPPSYLRCISIMNVICLISEMTKMLLPQITGAGHGMGREVALRFAKLGATVVCIDINAKGNEDTLKMIKQAKGKGFTYE